MRLTDQQLHELANDTAILVGELQRDNLPTDANLLDAMQATYAALRELQVWRASHPGQSVRLVFDTPFGPLELQ